MDEFNQAFGGQQFDNAGDAFTAGYLRMAGETELPGELNVLRNLLMMGRLEDHTGAVTVTRDGSLEVAPSNSNWGLRGSFGYDPSTMVYYRTMIPEGAYTPPGQSVDNALLEFEQSY
jgi:hypothetical protein